MARDRFKELVEKRDTLRSQLDEVEAELREEVLSWDTAGASARQPPKKATQRPAARKPAADAPATTATNGESQGKQNADGERQASLKEVVQDILGRSNRGMELKEIVAEVTKMIQSGEYHSKAKKVTPVVSQALFQLKQERLVAVERAVGADNRSRNLYSLSQTAA